MPESFKDVFIFLDTDKHASPFDILTIIDALPGVTVMKYENVTAEDAEKIIQDAIFPRGPEGVKHTKVFIDGQDFKQATAILDRIRRSMFSPFETAVIIDPRGAYTTASAAVAKVLGLSLSRNLGTLEGKVVAILAGTGPVGQTAARLFVTEKAAVIITSRELIRAQALATHINDDLKVDLAHGVEAKTSEEVGKAISTADVILSTGSAGTQLLPLDTLKQHGKKCKIIADINAIPPLGIEGMESEADGNEVLPGINGIGALSIGKLKNKVEIAMIKRAAAEPKGIFDYSIAYEAAKNDVLKKPAEKERHKPEFQKYWLP